MSADNFIAVQYDENVEGYYLSMEFASSCDQLERYRNGQPLYKTYEEALVAAHDWAANDVVEYGVEVCTSRRH